jgi:hypothetical protein
MLFNPWDEHQIELTESSNDILAMSSYLFDVAFSKRMTSNLQGELFSSPMPQEIKTKIVRVCVTTCSSCRLVNYYPKINVRTLRSRLQCTCSTLVNPTIGIQHPWRGDCRWRDKFGHHASPVPVSTSVVHPKAIRFRHPRAVQHHQAKPSQRSASYSRSGRRTSPGLPDSSLTSHANPIN